MKGTTPFCVLEEAKGYKKHLSRKFTKLFISPRNCDKVSQTSPFPPSTFKVLWNQKLLAHFCFVSYSKAHFYCSTNGSCSFWNSNPSQLFLKTNNGNETKLNFNFICMEKKWEVGDCMYEFLGCGAFHKLCNPLWVDMESCKLCTVFK